MSRVPVLHIITKMEFGGAQQNTLYTVATLEKDRFEPVLVTGPEGYLLPAAREQDIDVRIIPSMERTVRPDADISAYRELKKAFEPFRGVPSIVHTHSSKAGILGRWAANRSGIPIIIHSIHGFGFTPAQNPVERFFFKTVERATSRITDHFIAVSDSNRDDGIRMGLLNPERCSIIRSGFDLKRFSEARELAPKSLDDLGIPDGSPMVLMVACLKPQKAPLDFVHLAARVHSQIPEARFVLAGDGELRESLTKEIERLGVGDIFRAPGWREDIPELMKSSRVVILTSRWEGLPRVIPQAKAAGRPVVAAAVDGTVEAVRDGVDGFLCKQGDLDTMAERIISLLKNPALARGMGEEGSRTVEEWDQDVMVRKQEELYKRLLREKGLSV